MSQKVEKRIRVMLPIGAANCNLREICHAAYCCDLHPPHTFRGICKAVLRPAKLERVRLHVTPGGRIIIPHPFFGAVRSWTEINGWGSGGLGSFLTILARRKTEGSSLPRPSLRRNLSRTKAVRCGRSARSRAYCSRTPPQLTRSPRFTHGSGCLSPRNCQRVGSMPVASWRRKADMDRPRSLAACRLSAFSAVEQ